MSILPDSEYDALINWIGDTHETVIPTHDLRRRQARAFVVGDAPHYRAALIQSADNPGEPTGFGEDAEALWTLLQAAQGWFCVNVSATVAESLASQMQHDMNCPIRRYADVYFVLNRPVIKPERWPSIEVRLLTLDDLPLLLPAWRDWEGGGFGSREAILKESIAAAGIADDRLVAFAQMTAVSARYGDIGVFTDEAWRKQGISTAAASLVAEQIQARALTPTWSTGEDNFASMRVAHKLGFTEVSTGHRMYLIPQG